MMFKGIFRSDLQKIVKKGSKFGPPGPKNGHFLPFFGHFRSFSDLKMFLTYLLLVDCIQAHWPSIRVLFPHRLGCSWTGNLWCSREFDWTWLEFEDCSNWVRHLYERGGNQWNS